MRKKDQEGEAMWPGFSSGDRQGRGQWNHHSMREKE